MTDRSSEIFLDALPKYLFFLSLCAAIFLYGYATKKYKIFPAGTLDEGISELSKLLSEPRPHNLFPIRYERSGVTINIPEKTMPGVTLITSYWEETGWKAGLRLINANGQTLHHWEVNPEEIWPQSPHDDYVKNTKNINGNYIHGAYLYPNGDVVFNIEYLGLIRMDSLGEIVWKLPYRTHHSIFSDEEGYLWVSGAKWIESDNQRKKLFPGIQPPFTEETVLKISPEGEVILEISLLESLYKGGYQHLLRSFRKLKGDVLHLNDVEILSKDMANQFPQFDAGDIVVSIRDLSVIMVIGQEGAIKWINVGEFTRQHDPDFEMGGWITVFDNRDSFLGGSEIKQIRPENGEVKILYPTNGKQDFFTATAGKHQLLENGNRLIVESRPGRVFEITQEGETVWEWVQSPFDDFYVPEIHGGSRYKLEESHIESWRR